MLFTYPRALPANFYASDLEKAFFIEELRCIKIKIGRAHV